MGSLLSKINVIDCEIILSIASHRKKPVIIFMKLVTYTATGLAWFTLATLFTVLNFFGIQLIEKQSVFLQALFAPLIAWALGHIIKKTFKRLRPFQSIKNFLPLVSSPINDSFPSLHAASTISFFISLMIMQHPFAFFIGIWGALASYSRLYLGVHYLSDIVAGVILGFFCSCLLFLLQAT